MAKKANYSADSIQIKEGTEGLRHNISMYLGELGAPMIQRQSEELVDNAYDENAAGRNKVVEFVADPKENIYIVADQAGGIPLGTKKLESGQKINTLTAIFTMAHAGGKFDDSAYKTSSGCFTGDVRVRLLDGTTPTFKELYDRWQKDKTPFQVFSLNENNEVVIRDCYNVQLSKKVTRLSEVTLDNGEVIRCTLDHPFFTTAMKKVKASKLKPNMSLRALHLSTDKDGYLESSELGRVNRYVMESLGYDIENMHVHHNNHIVIDNCPSNLSILTQKEHYDAHPNKKDLWMKFVAETSHLKSKLIKAQNSDADYISFCVMGKVLKICCRLLNEDLTIDGVNYNQYMFQGAPKWDEAQKYFQGTDDIISSAETLFATYENLLDKKLEKGVRFFDSLNYPLGFSSTSIINNHSDLMVAKRLIGKGFSYLDRLGLDSETISNLTVSQFDTYLKEAQKDTSTNCTATSVLMHITLDRFVDSYLHGLDVTEFIYTDPSYVAYRKERIRALLKVPTWSSRSTKAQYSRFLLMLNSILGDFGTISRELYDEHRRQSYPSWGTGIELAKQVDGCSSIEELELLASKKNHKVVSVKEVKVSSTPVYGLSIEQDHNYLLASGVFVGNTHGVGAAASNAAADFFEVYTRKGKKIFCQKFTKGKPDHDVKEIKAFPKVVLENLKDKSSKYGTIIRFKPDQTIVSEDATKGGKKTKGLKVAKLDIAVTAPWMKDLANLHPGFETRFTVIGKKKTTTQITLNKKDLTHLIKNDIESYYGEEGEKPKKLGRKPLELVTKHVSFVCQWVDDRPMVFKSYVNSKPTRDGGTHVREMLDALSRALKPHMPKTKAKPKFTSNDLLFGMFGYLEWRMHGAAFSSQVKDKLVSKLDKVLEQELYEAFVAYFEENKALPKKLIKNAIDMGKGRDALMQTVKSIQEVNKSGGLPASLVQASRCKPFQRELYVVEGDSAGGTAKNARDNFNQEVLKLTGKILNCLTASVSQVLASKAVRNIILALGADLKTFDVKSDKPVFDCSKLRVQYLLLLSDSDPDGSHINVLILGLIFRFFPDLVKQGRVLIVDAPLFNAVYKDNHYGGMTWEECREALPDAAPDKLIGRAKGWGEVEVDILETIAFEPATRKLIQLQWPETQKQIEWFLGIAGDSADARKVLLGILKGN